MSFLRNLFGKKPKEERQSPKAEPTGTFEQPRYKENPVYLFFEAYVQDVIGWLPAATDQKLQSLDLQGILKTKASAWREVVREALALSDTIDIAILDRWYRDRDSKRRQGTDLGPEEFAIEFTDAYNQEQSTIDVWPAGELEAAKARVAAARAAEAANQREAQSRKERSVQMLKAEGVPTIDHLPVIEAEAESTRRTTEEVALRAVALALVSAKAQGLPAQMIDALVARYEASSAFSPVEARFMAEPNPSQADRIQMAWRFESYWVMLWACGFVDTLGRPDRTCDPEKATPMLIQNDRAGFLEKAALRPQAEILDAADLFYRYHWAVRNAQLSNRSVPAGLYADVAMERHYALNWLIGHMDQDWDDISTDT